MKIVGEHLRTLREGMQISQAKMAELVGMKQSSINRYEGGETSPSYEVLLKYADYFDVSIDYIFGRTDNPQGKLSLWLDVVDNRAPNMPGVVEPVANTTTSALRPTIKGSFSDPDETYGDKVKKFQIEVWSVNAWST